jgi:hypothetical protein
MFNRPPTLLVLFTTNGGGGLVQFPIIAAPGVGFQLRLVQVNYSTRGAAGTLFDIRLTDGGGITDVWPRQNLGVYQAIETHAPEPGFQIGDNQALSILWFASLAGAFVDFGVWYYIDAVT